MEVEDTKFEVFIISVAASLSLEHADLSVHNFQFAGADRMFVPIEDERLPDHQLACGIYQDSYLAALCFLNPCLKFLLRLFNSLAVKQQP